METRDFTATRKTWETAAPGWARWEAAIGRWMEPATRAMLDVAGVGPGQTVLDVACGAGSQTLVAARRVGPTGKVIGSDIAQTMLDELIQRAVAQGLDNIVALLGPAEDLHIAPASCDAVICRLGLMLFPDPPRALRAAQRTLRAGGRIGAVVFTTPAANPFMARPMQILLRCAGKPMPAAGQPGIFALGTPGMVERLLAEAGFVDVTARALPVSLDLDSAREALVLMQEAFGAYRAVVADLPEQRRTAAWKEVTEYLQTLETPSGFHGPGEVLVVGGAVS